MTTTQAAAGERPSRILICDDEPDIVAALKIYLESDGYETLTAANGKEALRIVSGGGVDLVLMDMRMPVMDGLEATKIIKERHPELPVIALTANAFGSDRDAAFDAGCDAFLPKPVSSNKCLDTIAEFLNK